MHFILFCQKYHYIPNIGIEGTSSIGHASIAHDISVAEVRVA